MHYKILASGSTGNCTILDRVIAIDMGIGYGKLKDHARKLRLVLLTHIHGDHFNKKTIRKISLNHPLVKFVCCEHLVQELANIVPKESIYVIETGKLYDLGICRLAAFDLVHDVKNVGYRIEIDNEKCIYATDTSILNVKAVNYDLYLIEGNYDETQAMNSVMQKQANGEYAYEIRAMQNHLSKQQCDEWLSQNNLKNAEFVYMHEHNERERYGNQ